MYGASSLNVFCLVGRSDLPQSSCLFYVMFTTKGYVEKVMLLACRNTKTVIVCLCMCVG